MRNFTSPNIQHYNDSQEEVKSNTNSKAHSRLQIVSDTDSLLKDTPLPAQELPPFEVLLSWLSYVHHQTGDWPLPPEVGENGTPVKSSLTDLSDSPVKSSSQILEKEQAKIIVGRHANPKMLKIISDQLPPCTSVKASGLSSSAFFSTNFSYVNSIYFEEAVRIIEKHSTRPIHVELLFGCKLTLSLIIAWSRFPLFNGMSGRRGRWITLGTAHCTRELKMRTASFRQYISELEEVGLLQTGQAGNATVLEPQEIARLRQDCLKLKGLFGPEAAHYWSERSVQTKTFVYRLRDTIRISLSLPQFNPFGLAITTAPTLAPEKIGKVENKEEKSGVIYRGKSGNTSDGENVFGKDQSLSRKDQESGKSRFTVGSRSFPGIPCYESIHDDDKNTEYFPDINRTGTSKAQGSQSDSSELYQRTDLEKKEIQSKVEEKPFDLLAHLPVTLTPDQQAKFEFLTEQARFTGYHHNKDGRNTLDTQEALKFALNSNLTLEILIALYEQVKEMWTRGQCYKNPLGLLHWVITRGCNSGGFASAAQFPATSFEKASTEGNEFNSSYLFTSGTTKRFGPSRPTLSGSQPLYRSGFQKRTGRKTGAKEPSYQQSENRRMLEKKELNNNNFLSGALPVVNKNNNESVGQAEEEKGEERLQESFQLRPGCKEAAISFESKSILSSISNPTFWKEVQEIDLAGRFRLSKQELELLFSSQLSFVPAVSPESEVPDKDPIPQLLIILRSKFEETRLGLTTRSIIQIALRQRLGPGYQLVFCSP